MLKTISLLKNHFLSPYPNNKAGRKEFIQALELRTIKNMEKVHELINGGQNIIFKNGLPLKIATRNMGYITFSSLQGTKLEHVVNGSYDNWIFDKFIDFYKDDKLHSQREKNSHLMMALKSLVFSSTHNLNRQYAAKAMSKILNLFPNSSNNNPFFTNILLGFCKIQFSDNYGYKEIRAEISQATQLLIEKGANIYVQKKGDCSLLEELVKDKKSYLVKVLLDNDKQYQLVENKQLLHGLYMAITVNSEEIFNQLLNHVIKPCHQQVVFDFLRQTKEKINFEKVMFKKWLTIINQNMEIMEKGANHHALENILPMKEEIHKKKKI